MDIVEKFCALWIIVMIKSGFLSAQFSTDILYKEVNAVDFFLSFKQSLCNAILILIAKTLNFFSFFRCEILMRFFFSSRAFFALNLFQTTFIHVMCLRIHETLSFSLKNVISQL